MLAGRLMSKLAASNLSRHVTDVYLMKHNKVTLFSSITSNNRTNACLDFPENWEMSGHLTVVSEDFQ